jgi:8-oxo-dGTP pyrophosphatase MutT (NUDIX family)
VLHREHRIGITWIPARSILPNEDPVEAVVRELFEETGLALIVDNLTLLSGNLVRVPLPAGQPHLVHAFSASVPVPYVTAIYVEQAVTPRSTVHLDGYYVVAYTIDIDGLSLTPSKTELVKETQRE